MAKKLFLEISAFLNFIVFALCGIMTYQMWASINTGAEAPTAGTGLAALAIALVMVIFAIATVIALVTFIIKLIAVKVEHNVMTFFAMLFDIVLVVFAIAINQDAFAQIAAGNIKDNIAALISAGIPAIPLLCDILSFPVDSSN